MRLLFIGDSLMEFFDWQARFQDHAVDNLGIAGETVEGLKARLDRVMGRIAPPDAIFIMSGINNLAMEDRGFIPAYRDIVRRLRQRYPSARIFINSLLPVLYPFISNDDVRESNRQLSTLAADEGVDYLDVHGRFLESDGRPRAAFLLDDGVHLSSEGYTAWSEMVVEALKDQQDRRR